MNEEIFSPCQILNAGREFKLFLNSFFSFFLLQEMFSKIFLSQNNVYYGFVNLLKFDKYTY